MGVPCLLTFLLVVEGLSILNNKGVPMNMDNAFWQADCLKYKLDQGLFKPSFLKLVRGFKQALGEVF